MRLRDIDAATWSALDRLLDEALDLPAEERERWLERLPPEARSLAPRLRALLSGPGGASLGTIPRIAPDTGGGAEGDVPEAAPGDQVGPFRLLRLLGEGGMGSVWLAERSDGLVQRQVALKLPRGLWAGPGLQDRMAREREILAGLEHPNIARLYDAGVAPGGRPWLALEYVEGQPIDAHARAAGLGVRARLGLFLQVAAAVAHAHARLVVHRDLKPGNVLVTGDGQVRLLDFGIAKLLEQGAARETELTRLAGRALTLAYASPEQIAGAPLGVASDVYSLGVLLCELLSGASPYRPARSTAAALEEAVLHGEPVRPSELCAEPALRRQLRGDLDTVVLKALRKRPEERYATVEAFREDVERYLAGQPVRAQPDTLGYRAGKFVGRHRLAVAAAAAVLVAVVGGAGAALWQARVARAEQRRAEEVKEFIASIFRDADPYDAGGKVPSAAVLLRRAHERIDRQFAGRPGLRVELLTLLGESLLAMEEVDGAEAALRDAIAEARPALGPTAPATVRARVAMTEVLRYRGKRAELREELRQLEPLLRRDPAGAEGLVRVLDASAHLEIDDGRRREAVEAARSALETAASLLGERHHRTVAGTQVLALALHYAHEDGPALEMAERAYRLTLELRGGNPRHPHVIDARSTLARALAAAGQLQRSVEEQLAAARDAAEVFGAESPMVGYFLASAAWRQVELGDLAGARAGAERALAILSRGASPSSYAVADALHLVGTISLAARRGAGALEDLDRALAAMRQAMGPGHRRSLAVQVTRARALAEMGRAAEAAAELAQPLAASDANAPWNRSLHVQGVAARLAGEGAAALRIQEEALRAVAPGGMAERHRMRIQAELGLAALEAGAVEKALPALTEAAGLFGRLQATPAPDRADVLLGLGRAHLAQGRPAQALPFLAEADAFWRGFDAASRWAGEAALWLGRCQRALGQSAEAGASLARAASLLERSPIPADARLAAGARGR